MTARDVTVAIIVSSILLFSAQAFADVDDEYTVSLLHFDGGITDESGKTWNAEGDAMATTTDKVFGTGSLYIDGTEDAIYTASSSEFVFSGDFSIDFRVKFVTMGKYVAIVDSGNYATSQGLYIQSRSNNTNISVYCNSTWVINVANTFSLDTWYHLALTRQDETIRLFIDGNQIATGTYANSIPSELPFKIGREPAGLFANAYYDEFRVSSGIARWTDNFTPPDAAYGSTPAPAIFSPVYLCSDGYLRLADGGRLYMR